MIGTYLADHEGTAIGIRSSPTYSPSASPFRFVKCDKGITQKVNRAIMRSKKTFRRFYQKLVRASHHIADMLRLTTPSEGLPHSNLAQPWLTQGDWQ